MAYLYKHGALIFSQQKTISETLQTYPFVALVHKNITEVDFFENLLKTKVAKIGGQTLAAYAQVKTQQGILYFFRTKEDFDAFLKEIKQIKGFLLDDSPIQTLFD